MLLQFSVNRSRKKLFPLLPKTNILSTPSAGQKDNCETRLVSGSQTSCTALLIHAEILNLLVGPQRTRPSPPSHYGALQTQQSLSELDSYSHWQHILGCGYSTKKRLLPCTQAAQRAQLTSTAQRLCMISLQQSAISPAYNNSGDAASQQRGTRTCTSGGSTVFVSRTSHSLEMPSCPFWKENWLCSVTVTQTNS